VKRDGIVSLTSTPSATHDDAEPSDLERGTTPQSRDEDGLTYEMEQHVEDIFDWEHTWAVQRTFLCAVRFVRNSESVTQSTTKVHGGVKPRR
jgi:hypothetical protein